jgi:hypothetical protein
MLSIATETRRSYALSCQDLRHGFERLHGIAVIGWYRMETETVGGSWQMIVLGENKRSMNSAIKHPNLTLLAIA